MTVYEDERDDQLVGDEAGLVNTARAQLKAYIDKLALLVREGEDVLVDMDARLERFDLNARRFDPTTAEARRRDDVREGEPV